MSRHGQTTPARVWWLALPDGLRVPVRAGLVIGRHVECDVVIDNEHVSRRHANVRPTASGVELVPLGRNPVKVNRVERTAAAELEHGDTIAIGDVELRVEAGTVESEIEAPWLISRGRASFSIRRMPFAIGGDVHDDLMVAGWPASAARLYRVDRALYVEVEIDGMTLDERALVPGVIEAVGDGDRLGFGGEALTVRQPELADATPTRPAMIIPDRVELRILPRGAQLTLSFGGIDRTVIVAERRLELLSVLLQPPAPYQPGAYIPDALIVQRVWARNDRADVSDLNVLVHRLRRDLIKVGAHGLAIVAREPGGNGTRFTLRAETTVTVT